MKSKLCAYAIAAAVIPSIFVIGSSAPASATPFNCSTGINANATAGWVRCDSGSGTYRARVTCYSGAGQATTVYGPWQGIGVKSTGTCPGASNAGGVSVDTH